MFLKIKKLMISAILLGFVVYGALTFFSVKYGFHDRTIADDQASVIVKLDTVKLKIEPNDLEYFYIYKKPHSSMQSLINLVTQRFPFTDQPIPFTRRDTYHAHKMMLIFYTMKKFNRNHVGAIPLNMEYLSIYAEPHYQTYNSYPNVDSEVIGVAHYNCSSSLERCRIYMKHSSLPLYFEFRVKTTEEFLGVKNSDWYTKYDWPDAASQIDEFITSLAVN